MEATAAWAPWNFQQSNWTSEPAGRAPAGFFFPVEPDQSSGGQPDPPPIDVVDFHSMEMKRINHNTNPLHVFEEAAREFRVDIDMMKMKIHRYPTSIREFKQFEQWFTAPRLVALGPYHHGQGQLKHAEKAKHVAAYHCILESGGHTVQEMYDAVVCAAREARSLYDKDAMAGVGDDDFLPMMFYDACFLVQYMVWYMKFMNTAGGSSAEDDEMTAVMEPSLRSFFDFNRKAIRHDIMLLENQIPWRVVAAVLLFRPVDLASFVAQWKDYLQDHKQQEKPFVLDDGYEPPHLLGLLRYYIVGRSGGKRAAAKPGTMSSISAIELAEIGIKLRANGATQQTEIIHMGVAYTSRTAGLFAELSLPPLSLDDERASFLINMAALELCSTSNFLEAEDEESAVCSYLLLLAMLVDREEDVHELRTRRLLQGGGGLTNKEALDFLTGLQSLPLRGSSCYIHVMEEIEKYRINRRLLIVVHAFLYKNRRAIFTILSVVGILVSILGTLMSLKSRSVLKK